jgi:tagatose 6-phosphate kinase
VAGGKGLNVARAIKRLGGQVVACALLAGFSGRWIEGQLRQEGIPAVLAWGEGETRTSISIIDPESGQLTEVYEYGDPVSPADWQAFEGAYAQALEGVGWVALSGRLPVGAPVDGYARLLSVLKSRSIPAALDASGEALRCGLAACPHVVKVNASEAAEIVEFEVTSFEQAARAGAALRSQGADLAVITLGSRGAVAMDGGLLVWHCAGHSSPGSGGQRRRLPGRVPAGLFKQAGSCLRLCAPGSLPGGLTP